MITKFEDLSKSAQHIVNSIKSGTEEMGFGLNENHSFVNTEKVEGKLVETYRYEFITSEELFNELIEFEKTDAEQTYLTRFENIPSLSGGEPRRIFWVVNKKYRDEAINKGEFKLSRYINMEITQQGREKTWVAEQVGIKYKTFITKLNNNTFTGEELLKLSDVLNFDLNGVKRIFISQSK